MWRDFFKKEHWTVAKAAQIYGIDKWGAGYFSVDDDGDVVVTPFGADHGPKISLHKIAKEVEERGLAMPVLLRIENILGSQIKLLHETFRKVIKENSYNGEYKGVFPIKVNQQKRWLKRSPSLAPATTTDLRLAPRPELIAAISMMSDKKACLICNGYKDEEFIDLGLARHQDRLDRFFCRGDARRIADSSSNGRNPPKVNRILASASNCRPRRKGCGPNRGAMPASSAWA